MAGETEEEVLTRTIEGYLFKQGGTRKKWKKRYFELSEGSILYYKSEEKKKLKGTLHLTEGWGVRSKRDCTCNWPVGLRPSRCFGLAMKDRTYYFYSMEEGIEDWADNLQAVIDVIGDPRDDPSNDHDGKPAGNKSKIAKVAVSLTTKAVKVAIQYAPVDDTVKDLVKAGADVVNDQVEAIPDSSTSKRVKTAGTRSMPSLSRKLTEEVHDNGIMEPDVAKGLTKGLGTAVKKTVLQPPGIKDLKEKTDKATGGTTTMEKMSGKVPGGAKQLSKLARGGTNELQEMKKGEALEFGGLKIEENNMAKGITKGLGTAIKKQPLKPPRLGRSNPIGDPWKAEGKISEDVNDLSKLVGGAKGLGKMAGSLGKAAREGNGIGDITRKKGMDRFPNKTVGNNMTKKIGMAACKTSAKGIGKGVTKEAGNRWGKFTTIHNEQEEEEEEDDEEEEHSYQYEEEGEEEEEEEEGEDEDGYSMIY